MNKFVEGEKICRISSESLEEFTYAGPSRTVGYIVVRHHHPDGSSVDFDEHPDVWEVAQ